MLRNLGTEEEKRLAYPVQRDDLSEIYPENKPAKQPNWFQASPKGLPGIAR
ncbi:MAG: hypothetical protein MI921_04805 [Cytophagales bacterium]|nr:hypothetical protein [Cytophagales bacterium]